MAFVSESKRVVFELCYTYLLLIFILFLFMFRIGAPMFFAPAIIVAFMMRTYSTVGRVLAGIYFVFLGLETFPSAARGSPLMLLILFFNIFFAQQLLLSRSMSDFFKLRYEDRMVPLMHSMSCNVRKLLDFLTR